MKTTSRTTARRKRHQRVRTKVSGTAARPRLSVMVSNKRIYVQFIDDDNAVTLAAASTIDNKSPMTKSVADATELGKRAADAAKEKGIQAVVMDRGGFKFHGRVKAIADAVREAGIAL